MIIGFDLDNVFINTPPFIPKFIFDRFYRNSNSSNLSYRIPKKPEQLLRIALHHPALRRPIQKNLRFIQITAKDKNNKRYIISSRFGFLKNRTNEIVKKHQFNKLFTGIYFNYDDKQPHEFKNEVIKKLKIDKYIDDDLKLLEYLSKRNPRVKFYWLNAKQQQQLDKNLTAITSLDDAL